MKNAKEALETLREIANRRETPSKTYSEMHAAIDVLKEALTTLNAERWTEDIVRQFISIGDETKVIDNCMRFIELWSEAKKKLEATK